MANQSYRAQVPAEVNNVYNRKLLTVVLPLFTYAMFGQKATIPLNSGTNVMKWRRYTRPSAATTAITEGATPTNGYVAAVTDITATALQYGDYTYVSDVLQDQSIDPVVLEFIDLFGGEYADTLDQLTRDIIAAGTVVQYSASRVSRVTVAAGDVPAIADIAKAELTLTLANARRLSGFSAVSPGVGTVPIPPAYVGITYPSVTVLLRAMTGWTPVEKYNANIPVLPGETGTIGRTRYIETTNAKIFTGAGAAGIDVHCILFIGAEAYGTVDLGNSSNGAVNTPKIIIQPATDPLHQRSSVGWKDYYVAKILNDAFLVRYEFALV